MRSRARGSPDRRWTAWSRSFSFCFNVRLMTDTIGPWRRSVSSNPSRHSSMTGYDSVQVLHFEHDLPSVVGTERVLERAARLNEREDPVDHNAQSTGVDAASQLRELIAVGLDDEVAGANLVLACQLSGRLLDERHEGSARKDHPKRARQRVAAGKVYHQVDRRNHLFKANRVAIQYVV